MTRNETVFQHAPRLLALLAGLIALLCLAGAAAALVLLSQAHGSPATLLRIYTLQTSSPIPACAAPARLVPGSYQASPVQVVGDFVLLTYTEDCAGPGQSGQSMEGFVAIGGQGDSCAGSGILPPAAPAATGQVIIDGVSGGRCGSLGPGGSLSVVWGQVSGAGAVSAQVQYAGGFKAAGPIHNGRFALAAPEASPICAVRALDAAGAVLAEIGMGAPGTGNCP